jgi:alpha-tubulin suppressor-like RCC1 family protein
MSQINVNRIKDSNEGAPDFPSGVNVGGITSTVTLGVTNLNTTNVNVSGVVTATTLDGSLLATGTPTLGLGVTINTSGLNISGVATAGIVSATTLYGDGTNLTGIALTIAPLNYNPAVLGSDVSASPGIGLTFNQGVKAGSGNVTLRISGAAGTVVQNWGVGSSISYSNGDTISLSLDSNLSNQEVYHLSYPSGAFTNIGGDLSYVGTAYTFSVKPIFTQLWTWGVGTRGVLAQNNTTAYSSPIQIPGTNWTEGGSSYWSSESYHATAHTKTDGTLWVWGSNAYGQLGQNDRTQRSSPVQVPGTTWTRSKVGKLDIFGTKSDGTLWAWGRNFSGMLGINVDSGYYSSPVQIPGTTWPASGTKRNIATASQTTAVIKTDGTLWTWGHNSSQGALGHNNRTDYSSPTQVPGTTWSEIAGGHYNWIATKTDGTLWSWGYGLTGGLGLNQGGALRYSSPTQIPGTNWAAIAKEQYFSLATKTDGTLWAWGWNAEGVLGQNNKSNYSSPVQIPGTTWSTESKNLVATSRSMDSHYAFAVKTDGTMWSWGANEVGTLGHNNTTHCSSPVQIPGSWNSVTAGQFMMQATKQV